MWIVWTCLFIVLVLVGWFLNVMGMPGNWLIVGVSAGYALLTPQEGRSAIGWWVIGTLVVLACIGELIEFLAGMMGARKAGASKRGAVLALLGSISGAVVGIFVGIPVPVIGQLIAAVLFACAGALVGAMVGESWKGRGWSESWEIGKAAFWGRFAGTVGKTLVGTIMAGVAVAAVFI